MTVKEKAALALIKDSRVKAVKTLCLKKAGQWVCIAPEGHDGTCDVSFGIEFEMAHTWKFGRRP